MLSLETTMGMGYHTSADLHHTRAPITTTGHLATVQKPYLINFVTYVILYY